MNNNGLPLNRKVLGLGFSIACSLLNDCVRRLLLPRLRTVYHNQSVRCIPVFLVSAFRNAGEKLIVSVIRDEQCPLLDHGGS